MNLSKLYEEFPRGDVHWRAQSITKDGTAAMALAYIDARDVMDRLDSVCGPNNWSDSYEETARGRMICAISIKIGDEWVSKSDGAGSTDVEGDKGAISDAFKRAAVKWGIGRYLYHLDAPWVPCEARQFNGKWTWRKWTADPWSCVKGKENARIPLAISGGDARAAIDCLNKSKTLEELQQSWGGISIAARLDDRVFAAKEKKKAELSSELVHRGAG